MKQNEQHNSPKPAHTPQLGVFVVVHSGFIVKASPLLPTPKTVEVCEIETKRHITIPTGEYVDCIQMGKVLYVSQKVYDALL